MNIYNPDRCTANVVGLVGVPVEIETTQEFDTAELVFTYDEGALGETAEDKMDYVPYLNLNKTSWYEEKHNYIFMDEEKTYNGIAGLYNSFVLPWTRTIYFNHASFTELLRDRNSFEGRAFEEALPDDSNKVKYYWHQQGDEILAAYSVILSDEEYEKIPEERVSAHCAELEEWNSHVLEHEVNQKYRFDGVLFNDETCEIIEISYYGPLKLDKDSNEETIIWTW